MISSVSFMAPQHTVSAICGVALRTMGPGGSLPPTQEMFLTPPGHLRSGSSVRRYLRPQPARRRCGSRRVRATSRIASCAVLKLRECMDGPRSFRVRNIYGSAEWHNSNTAIPGVLYLSVRRSPEPQGDGCMKRREFIAALGGAAAPPMAKAAAPWFGPRKPVSRWRHLSRLSDAVGCRFRRIPARYSEAMPARIPI
jgi:hypothetical protein